MGSVGIDPSNLIVKPVTADGLHEKDVRSAEKSVRSRSTLRSKGARRRENRCFGMKIHQFDFRGRNAW